MPDKTQHAMAVPVEKWLPTVIDLIPYPIFVKDEAGCFLLVNRAGSELAGVSADELIGRKAEMWTRDPEVLEELEEQDRKVLKEGIGLYQAELNLVDHQGKAHVYELTKVPIQLPEGKSGLLGVAVEKTRSRQIERALEKLVEEKDLLLREVHHRIKNNMNNMVMLLTIQAETLREAAAVEALHDARSRIQTMMVIYDKLYRSVDYSTLSLREYLGSLLEEVKGTFPNHDRIHVLLDVDDLQMDSRKLFQVGIILNELFTNAMKHAYGPGEEGNVHIKVREMDDLVQLEVQDFGVGLPDPKSGTSPAGFGLELIQMLVLQMGGSMEIQRENGVRFLIRLTQ